MDLTSGQLDDFCVGKIKYDQNFTLCKILHYINYYLKKQWDTKRKTRNVRELKKIKQR